MPLLLPLLSSAESENLISAKIQEKEVRYKDWKGTNNS